MAPGVLTFKRVVGWGLPLVALTLAVGFVIGRLAAPAHQTFAWDVAAVAATAFATAALAAFTGALAFTTSGDVRATWQLADQGREDLESRNRPNVFVVPVQEFGTAIPDTSFGFGVRVTNVGLAPATFIEVEAVFDIGREIVGGARVPFLLPGSWSPVTITLNNLAADDLEGLAATRPSLGGTCRDQLENPHPVRSFGGAVQINV